MPEGWMCLKGANQMAVSGVGFRNAVVSTGWAVSLTKQSSNLVGLH